MPHQRAGPACHHAGEAEGKSLGPGHVHSHGLRRDLGIAYCHEGPSQRRAKDVAVTERHDQHDREAEPVEEIGRGVAVHLHARDGDVGRDQSDHPAGPGLGEHDDVLGQDRKGERRDGKIDAVQPEGGNRDEDAGEPGDHARSQEGGDEGKPRPIHQDRVGVAAHREKRRMAEACLAGMTRQHHESHARNGPDQDIGGLAQQEVVQQQRHRRRESHQGHVAERAPDIRKEPDVLGVAGLEGGAHQTFLAWTWAKRPRGRMSSTRISIA